MRFLFPFLLAFLAPLPLPAAQAAAPAAAPPLPPAQAPLHPPHDRWIRIPAGEFILRAFPAAPYPDPSRARGYTYQGRFYSAAAHYRDSTVGIFIPRGYRRALRVNYIIHFHGWNNHVARVLRRYRLPEQVAAARANAILLVPQGPYDAPDSGEGKLSHRPGDFALLLRQITAWLRRQGILRTRRIGEILLSAHSGGYHGAAQSLAIGGLADRVRQVMLFDAAYGGLPAFAGWMQAGRHRRFVSVFTDDTIAGNVRLMAAFQAAQIRFRVLRSAGLNRALARHHGRWRWNGARAIFLYTPHLPHDLTLQDRGYFRLFLAAAHLPRVRGSR